MTLADKCYNLWFQRPHDKTLSLLNFARKFVDADVVYEAKVGWKIYRFSDDSLLYSSGTGRSHKVWTDRG